MLIEVSMLQRLIVFLGHPIYGLSVILFVLLLAGGLGSYLSTRIADDRLRDSVSGASGSNGSPRAHRFRNGPLVTIFADAETPVRIAVSRCFLARWA